MDVGDAVVLQAADPQDWIVVFRPTSENWLVRSFVPGRFKHVAALAYLAGLKAWVTFDVGFDGTKITVIPDGAAAAVLTPWLDGCTLVRIRKRDLRHSLALFGWCAPSVARLIGLRGGTLRPDALYRQCLRNGGTIVGHERTRPHADAAAASPGRSGA